MQLYKFFLRLCAEKNCTLVQSWVKGVPFKEVEKRVAPSTGGAEVNWLGGLGQTYSRFVRRFYNMRL